MEKIHFKADKEKQMLYGPFLIPNMLIYRSDDTNGEYYVRFSAEEIDKIASKFNSDLNSKNINLQHSDKKVEAFVAQNWVIDGGEDKSKNLGFDLPEGTWFGGVKITDKAFWDEKVKTNEVKGFSVEILADLELQLKNKEQKMEKQIKLGSSMLGDGSTPIFYDGESISVGTAIFTDEAMTMPAPDDRWVLEDGRTIVVVAGSVESIEEAIVEDLGYKDDKKKKEDEMIEDMPVEPTSKAITSEEVSMMIDARFSELMDEITALKTKIDVKEEKMSQFQKEVNEKFSSVPAAKSIKEEKIYSSDSNFSKMEQKIKAFAKS